MNKMFQALIKNTLEFKILLSMIIFAVLTRVAIPPFIGHPPNFSAIDAIALFCGAYFGRRFIAFIVVFLSVWIGDVFLNKIFMNDWVLFYSGFYWQYGCYFLITFLGTTLKDKVKPIHLASACLSSAVLFFVISNFGVWCSGFLYPLNLDGLVACYVSAIPFFKNTLFSDLFFSILLFVSFGLIQIGFPSSRINKSVRSESKNPDTF
jgi:hypothetical protein